MNGSKRPLSIIILGCVYIVIGFAGFVYHFPELQARNGFRDDILWIELVSLIAIVCGVFLLRGHNWARWVALAWMAFHVVLSVFHSWPEFAVHVLFFAVIAWLLFRPGTARSNPASRLIQ